MSRNIIQLSAVEPVVDSGTIEADELPAKAAGRPFPLRLIFAGFLLVAAFVGGGAGWMTFAPIESAVVSPGIVSVASFRKQIQHFEGGIVDSILVGDGDRVTAGQLLVQLRDVQPTAELRQLERQYLEGRAVIARLLAEQEDAEQITFPDELLVREEEKSVHSVISGQKGVFGSRRVLVRDRRSVLENQIVQAGEEINGISAQLSAKTRQQVLIREELASVEKALQQKLVPKSMALKLRQRVAETDGEISAYKADIGRLEQSILEMQLQISEAHAQWIADITEQLRDERARLFDISQRMVSERDVLERTKIVSPIDGVVVNLQIHTRDGVIGAGEPLMEIVPSDDELVVHAFVNPEDIDEVRAGMPADVRLTSVNRRQRVPLEGTVTHISADRLLDAQTGLEYFRARVELAPEVAASAKPHLVAGMGADVFIRTGARTPLDYLVSPIAKNIQFGFREQ